MFIRTTGHLYAIGDRRPPAAATDDVAAGALAEADELPAPLDEPQQAGSWRTLVVGTGIALARSRTGGCGGGDGGLRRAVSGFRHLTGGRQVGRRCAAMWASAAVTVCYDTEWVAVPPPPGVSFAQDYPEAQARLAYLGDERLQVDSILCLPVTELLHGIVPGTPLS